MKLTEEQQQVWNSIYNTYKKLLLTKKETAEIVGLSTATLDRLRAKGMGISYKKLETKSKSNNGLILYPLQEIVKYITSNNIQTV